MRSEQEVALVSGASRGIGRHLALCLLEQGYLVEGCSRGDGGIDHPNYGHTSLDVSSETSVISYVRSVYRKHGRVDALINNAGIAAMNHVLMTPGRVVSAVFDTNFKGTFLLTREAAKRMQKRNYGRILNFSSIAVKLSLEGEAVYAAAKAAVESFTKVAARELSPHGITVNAIAPGPIKTDLVRGVPTEKLDALVGRQVVKRYGAFDDVWATVRFLLDRENSMVSGQIISIGGA